MSASTLSALVDDLLRTDFEASPVMASALGLTEYDERLDDLSAEAFERRDADAAAFLARFDAVGDEGLSLDERIDRDLARAVLRGRTILADWRGWRRDPVVYSGPITSGLFGLFLHRLRPDADLVDAAVARLEQVEAAVDAGIANLDPGLAHPLIVGRGRGAAEGALRYVRDLLPDEVTDPGLRERLRSAGAAAAPHLERWVAHLGSLAEGATGEWQLGEERYTRLLREKEVLADDARSLRGRGQAEFDRLDAEMRALAREAAGDEDYVAVLRAADEDHPPTEDAMRATYEEWTARSRAFLAETGLFTLPPGESCAVEPSPVFQRPVLGVASYMAPPAFSESWRGHFFVPYAPDGTPPDEIAERLKNNSHSSIPTTAAHETYPGHHWHLVMRKRNPSRIRKVYGTPYFNEGWALYTERVMREHGFFTEPIQVLQHLNATLFRAARIVVDTSLHLGEMSHDEGVRFMVDKAALPEPVARAEVGRYCWWPTQASAYLTGCLAILDLRERYLAARGVGGGGAGAPVAVLREFHDALAGSGSLPLGLAEEAVMAGVGTATG